MTNRIIDTYVKNFLTYHHKDWYWVINPITNEWVVAVSEDNGYTFYNRKFWSDFIMFYPLGDLTDNIKNWVVHKLGVPPSKHCYPDYISGEYDWSNEFNKPTIIKVINQGVLVPSHKHDPHF
jgi:hypothetical protein